MVVQQDHLAVIGREGGQRCFQPCQLLGAVRALVRGAGGKVVRVVVERAERDEGAAVGLEPVEAGAAGDLAQPGAEPVRLLE